MRLLRLVLLVLSVATLAPTTAPAATPDLYFDRGIQSIHPEEATRLQPDYERYADASNEVVENDVKALEASVSKPVLVNRYNIKALNFFVAHPVWALVLIVGLLAALPVVVTMRQD